MKHKISVLLWLAVSAHCLIQGLRGAEGEIDPPGTATTYDLPRPTARYVSRLVSETVIPEQVGTPPGLQGFDNNSTEYYSGYKWHLKRISYHHGTTRTSTVTANLNIATGVWTIKKDSGHFLRNTFSVGWTSYWNSGPNEPWEYSSTVFPHIWTHHEFFGMTGQRNAYIKEASYYQGLISDTQAKWTVPWFYYEGWDRREGIDELTVTLSERTVAPVTPTHTVRSVGDWLDEPPAAIRDGNSEVSSEYYILASHELKGVTASWREVSAYTDSGHEVAVPKYWKIDSQKSPTFQLKMEGNGWAYGDEIKLLIARLAVDANRDGEITLSSEATSDTTSSVFPFRFWLNDDDDERVMRTWTTGSTYTENEQDDKEVTSDANKDCNNVVIDTERDLEDLARLWIYTAGLTDALKNGTLRLGLKWTDVSSGSPAVRLFKAVEADGGNAYLFTPGTATLQVDQTAATGAHGMAVGSLIEGTSPVPLPTGLFANLSESQPKTYLLFEGARAGTGQLKLVILDQNGQPIGEGPGVWLDLKQPHELVERYTCGDQSIGAVGALTHYTPSATFGAPTTEAERDYVLYVHGYNMEDPEKQRWIETTFKRLYWLGYKGLVGGFSWPCAFGLIDQIRFDESEERAWQAGVRLLEHLQNLKNAGYRVHVVAHSQGNVVMSEALRQWRAAGNATALVNTYIASQAAVAAHSYNAAAPLMPDYEQTTPNVYAVYWRAGDSARFPQTWPATNPPYFTDSIMQSTVGHWVNFYNPQDYALTAANGGIGSWESDQRLKPDNFYNWSVTNGFFKGLVPFETSYSFPDDRYTIFSFCAEARSVAMGANATGGVFSDATNLQGLGYAGEHLWHSGQFRSFMAARQQYWAELLRKIGLQPYTP